MAQWYLGHYYAKGEGVAKDYAEAYAWYNLASGTFTGATERDDLEKTMSPQQVTDAQERTRELRQRIEARRKGGGK